VEASANPYLIYALLTLGALGVALSMPRRSVSPQLLGAIVAGAGIGGVFLAVALTALGRAEASGAEPALPGAFFYIFSLIALGSALRVITHPRPVYAALYFILTILASSALYLLLGAEFLAFALIIIYAGAILITYLFVIMLATQAPSEEEPATGNPYDKYSREPALSTGVGFVLIAILTGIMSGGVGQLSPNVGSQLGQSRLADLPKKVVGAYERLGIFRAMAEPTLESVSSERLDIQARTLAMTVQNPSEMGRVLENENVASLRDIPGASTKEGVMNAQSGDTVIFALPPRVQVTNIDGVGFSLIAEHPMALELAGVILLMALLGAVVLARKQIEIGEAEKTSQSSVLGGGGVV